MYRTQTSDNAQWHGERFSHTWARYCISAVICLHSYGIKCILSSTEEIDLTTDMTNI